MIWPRIIAALWKPLAWLGGLLSVYVMGRADARQKAALDAAENELQAIERIVNADHGAGLSDAERVQRLEAIAKRLGG